MFILTNINTYTRETQKPFFNVNATFKSDTSVKTHYNLLLTRICDWRFCFPIPILHLQAHPQKQKEKKLNPFKCIHTF